MDYDAKKIAKWFLTYNEKNMIDGDAEYISNLKLQKLLYYAQGTYLAIKNKSLFADDIVAWEHGPVVVDVYHEYRNNGSFGIQDYGKFDLESIDVDTRRILEEVYAVFGQYSAWKLREMTHEETPWKSTEQGKVIKTDVIKKYFSENYIA